MAFRLATTLLRRASPRLRGSCVAAAGSFAAAAAVAGSSTPSSAEAAPPVSSSEKGAGSDGGLLPSALTSPFTYASDKVYEYVVAPYAEPSRDKLLPDIPPQIKGREKPTLVISLDGTLIESQWTRQYGWRYVKRPGVDEFLAALQPLYEIVLWTDALSTAETAIDRLDPRRCIRHRLYRDATTYSGGLHRKDLSALNRDLSQTLIIDCDARCYSFQPQHGICVRKYESASDPAQADAHLKRLLPFLWYCAVGKRGGSVTDFSEELQRLGVSTTLADNGEDFERAVGERFAELRKEGRMPQVQRGGRVAYAAGTSGPTLWNRMGLGGARREGA